MGVRPAPHGAPTMTVQPLPPCRQRPAAKTVRARINCFLIRMGLVVSNPPAAGERTRAVSLVARAAAPTSAAAAGGP